MKKEFVGGILELNKHSDIQQKYITSITLVELTAVLCKNTVTTQNPPKKPFRTIIITSHYHKNIINKIPGKLRKCIVSRKRNYDTP